MKNCAYCKTPVPKKQRHWWRAPYSSMGSSEPVCINCVIKLKPEGFLEVVGAIGVIGYYNNVGN